MANAILALDLGTYTGFALGPKNGAWIMRGSWFLGFDKKDPTKGRRHFDGGGLRYARLTRNLDTLHAHQPIGRIVFEEVRRHKGVIAAHIYGGLMAHLQTWCESQVPPIPYAGVGVGVIKKHMTGKGTASKAEMMLAVEKAGYPCDSDDEADAVALLLLMQKRE